MALLPKPPELPGAPGDKFQHMLAFLTLAGLAATGWRKTGAVHLFLPLSAFGGAIELLQMIPALHRSAEWFDWFADMAAAAIGLAIARLAVSRLT